MAFEVLRTGVHSKDVVGQIKMWHAGQVIPWLSDAERDRLIRKGLVRELSAGRHEAAEAAPTTAAVGVFVGDEQVGQIDVPVDEPAQGGRPRQVAPKEAWVDYGISLGHDRELLESMTKADLIAQLT